MQLTKEMEGKVIRVANRDGSSGWFAAWVESVYVEDGEAWVQTKDPDSPYLTVKADEVLFVVPNDQRWCNALGHWGPWVRFFDPVDSGVAVGTHLDLLEELVGDSMRWIGDKYVDLATLIRTGEESGLITCREQSAIRHFLANFALG